MDTGNFITETYDMGSTYNPASQTTTFKWTVGTFDMVLYGKVPLSASNVAHPVNVVSFIKWLRRSCT